MSVEARPTTSHNLEVSRGNFSSQPDSLLTHEKTWEKCGVTGIYNKNWEAVSHLIPAMQSTLQHRGQDAAGKAVFYSEKGISIEKGKGLIHEVFPYGPTKEERMVTHMGIGHNRYGTDQEGDNRGSVDATQPMKASWEDPNSGKTWEMAVAFNGNLPDFEREKLRGRMPKEWRNEKTFDTLELTRAIVSADGETWNEKIKNGLVGIDMAYSLTMVTHDGKLFGLRGPSGTWPLWVGESGDNIVLSSETRTDQAEIASAKLFDDISWTEVKPGELIEATPDGIKREKIFDSEGLFRCTLHDAYGARADSFMTPDRTYGDFRHEVGKILAEEHPVYDAKYVGIPESGLVFADGYADAMGTEATSVITKKDERRSYIADTEEGLGAIINGKYVIEAEDRIKIDGQKVVVTEDSVIKGTTLGGKKEEGKKEIKGVVQLLREAGAKEVHVRTALQTFVDTEGCDLGYVIDGNKLVAVERMEDGSIRKRTNEEIAEKIGADSFEFVSSEGILKAYEKTTGSQETPCMSCQGGEHPKDMLSKIRSRSQDVILNSSIVYPIHSR